MGRIYVANYASSDRLGIKKRTLPRHITLGPTTLKFIAVVIFSALGCIYLIGQTRGANLSVEVRSLDSSEQDLKMKIERLNEEGARLRALNGVYTETSSQMQPATVINHLPGEKTVAVK